jgi:murein endopeptidase
VSHQNGLDVDIFFPRLDRRERPPDRPDQIDRALAQDLVDRFVRAGAVRVFVGPNTGLRGDPRVVQVLAGHDNHLHARIQG